MTLYLSPQHGLNPSLDQCFLCQKDRGIMLLGRLPGDVAAPHKAAYSREPCDECKSWQQKGVIVISVDSEKSDDRKNPYRTGGWAVVTEDGIRKLIDDPALLEQALRVRVVFVDTITWTMAGLPPIESKEGDHENGA